MTSNGIAVTMNKGRGADNKAKLPDIKPKTKISTLRREDYFGLQERFPIETVSVTVGMSSTFIRKVVGQKERLTVQDVLVLLDQDSFKETIVPRSRVIDYLLERARTSESEPRVMAPVHEYKLLKGHALDLLRIVPRNSVQCVATSTPYWGMRIYDESYVAEWADGETAAYGHEQTPEGFVRHTTR